MSGPQPPFLTTGAPPPGWGQEQTAPTAQASSGERLAAPEPATRILQGVATQFAAADVALPERQYIGAGTPRSVAWDCEQLTVTASAIAWGVAAARGAAFLSEQVGTQMGVGAVRHIVMEVALVRKLPDGATLDSMGITSLATITDVDALQAAGEQCLRDMGLLSQAMVAMFVDNGTGTIVPVGSHADAGPVETAGPEGDYYGILSTVSVTLGELA